MISSRIFAMASINDSIAIQLPGSSLCATGRFSAIRRMALQPSLIIPVYFVASEPEINFRISITDSSSTSCSNMRKTTCIAWAGPVDEMIRSSISTGIPGRLGW